MHMHPNLFAALFAIAKIWKQPKHQSINEWINNIICVCIYVCVCLCIHIHTCTHTHKGILLSHKKNEILPFATTWMNQESITLSEVGESTYDSTYMWTLENKTNEQT